MERAHAGETVTLNLADVQAVGLEILLKFDAYCPRARPALLPLRRHAARARCAIRASSPGMTTWTCSWRARTSTG